MKELGVKDQWFIKRFRTGLNRKSYLIDDQRRNVQIRGIT